MLIQINMKIKFKKKKIKLIFSDKNKILKIKMSLKKSSNSLNNYK